MLASIFATIPLVLAALVCNTVAAPADKRLLGITSPLDDVSYCRDIGYTGPCNTPSDLQLDFCQNVPTGLNDNVSSFKPGLLNSICTLFSNVDCTGSSIKINSTGQPDLKLVGFNDVLSSYSCSLL